MLKVKQDGIKQTVLQVNPHCNIESIDGTFNTNNTKNHVVFFELSMDCNHHY